MAAFTEDFCVHQHIFIWDKPTLKLRIRIICPNPSDGEKTRAKIVLNGESVIYMGEYVYSLKSIIESAPAPPKFY